MLIREFAPRDPANSKTPKTMKQTGSCNFSSKFHQILSKNLSRNDKKIAISAEN